MKKTLNWHGGKNYLAPWIIENFPPRCENPGKPGCKGYLHYVEPYFGGGSVLFAQDPEGISEAVNDINYDVANFWNVMRREDQFESFARMCSLTPFSQDNWDHAVETLDYKSRQEGYEVASAWRFFVRYRQSRQGLGKDFATLTRNRTRRGMNEQVSAWLSAVEGLPEAHERLKRVVILNEDALKVIKQQDGPRTLFYCDPTYLHQDIDGSKIRETTDDYQHEMDYQDHVAMLAALSRIKGRFALSGYPSMLYEMAVEDYGWRCATKQIDNKASSKKTKDKKIECLWMNYDENGDRLV